MKCSKLLFAVSSSSNCTLNSLSYGLWIANTLLIFLYNVIAAEREAVGAAERAERKQHLREKVSFILLFLALFLCIGQHENNRWDCFVMVQVASK